jgi:hypothetical protein
VFPSVAAISIKIGGKSPFRKAKKASSDERGNNVAAKKEIVKRKKRDAKRISNNIK